MWQQERRKEERERKKFGPNIEISSGETEGIRSKKISIDQELTQSDPISCPQNQRRKKWIHKLTAVYESTRGKPNEQLFPRQVVIPLPKLN